MKIDFRLPNITAKDEKGQLQQMQSYMFQLVDQLNWAMKTIEGGSSSDSVVYLNNKSISGAGSSATGGTGATAPTNFNEIKGLIIKSADIVNAYYEEINKKLKGEYVAQSDFGTFRQDTTSSLEATSDSISQLYTNLQQITSDIEGFENSLIDVTANINTGLLYYDELGVPVYGLEVGQRTVINGEETFNKYARFTADKLSFYDNSGSEVAYISDKKLYITHVEVTGSFTLGGFVDTVLPDKSVVTKWIGGADNGSNASAYSYRGIWKS